MNGLPIPAHTGTHEGLRLILGSASPARRKLLREAGLEPIVRVSEVDEDAILDAARAAGSPSATEQVLLLAEHKAHDVAAQILAESDDGAVPGEFILGCDSMLEIDGQVVGKPATPKIAMERWRSMRGRTGILHTGHYLIDLRGAASSDRKEAPQDLPYAKNSCSTTIFFGKPSDDELRAYISTGEPLRVAGAFTLDGLGSAFVTGVEGDHASVIGVSPALLGDLLNQLGTSITELWA